MAISSGPEQIEQKADPRSVVNTEGLEHTLELIKKDRCNAQRTIERLAADEVETAERLNAVKSHLDLVLLLHELVYPYHDISESENCRLSNYTWDSDEQQQLLDLAKAIAEKAGGENVVKTIAAAKKFADNIDSDS